MATGPAGSARAQLRLGFDPRLTPWNSTCYPSSALRFSKLPTGFDLGDATTLAWAAQLAYEVGRTANDLNKVSAIVARWGWRNLRFLQTSRPIPFDPRALIADTDQGTVLAFCGTEPTNAVDWKTDFLALPSADGLHEGFAAATDAALAVVAPALQGRVISADKPLHITGHSLGGALTALTAYRLRQRRVVGDARSVRVVTYGMPRVGGEDFAREYRVLGLGDVTWRLVHGEDIVPKVPFYAAIPASGFSGYRHVGTVVACPHLGRFVQDRSVVDAPESPPLNDEQELFTAMLASLEPDPLGPAFPGTELARLLPRAVRDHLTDRYLRALGAVIACAP